MRPCKLGASPLILSESSRYANVALTSVVDDFETDLRTSFMLTSRLKGRAHVILGAFSEQQL